MKTFSEVWNEFEGIQYGFTREEASVLFTLANLQKTCGDTVEIGSMQGGSACLLEAAGCRVYCVDPIENPLYYAMFLKNTEGKRIHHLRMKDSQAWRHWPPENKISFLLIDHDHSYASTLASLLNWRPLLTPGAVVLVHDYGDEHWVDVKPATLESGLTIDGVEGRLAWGHWEGK